MLEALDVVDQATQKNQALVQTEWDVTPARRGSATQCLAWGLHLRPKWSTGDADPPQVTVGHLQGSSHLQDLQTDAHGVEVVAEGQSVVNPQSRIFVAGRPWRRRDVRVIHPSRWSTTGDIA